MRLVVTGGAGFIGSCFVRLALTQKWAERVLTIDKLTYAGNLENLEPVAHLPGYGFVQGDICDGAKMDQLLATENPTQ
jgi:dTDP-glucose 4,6-dehydratase